MFIEKLLVRKEKTAHNLYYKCVSMLNFIITFLHLFKVKQCDTVLFNGLKKIPLINIFQQFYLILSVMVYYSDFINSN